MKTRKKKVETPQNESACCTPQPKKIIEVSCCGGDEQGIQVEVQAQAKGGGCC